MSIETLFESEDFGAVSGGLEVDEARVYWAGGLDSGGRGVRSISKAGGAIIDLTAGFDYAVGPALDGPRAIFKLSKTGGDPVAITDMQEWPHVLAIDESTVYFTNNTWQGTIKRSPK